MDKIEAIWELLPQIISFLVAGFVFLKVYEFVGTSATSKTIETTFFSSLVVGFLLIAIEGVIIKQKNWSHDGIVNLYDITGCLLIPTVLGAITGKIRFSNGLQNALAKLNIRSTLGNYLWDDLIERDQTKELWLRLRSNEKEIEYIGVLDRIEISKREPQIFLRAYTRCDAKTKVEESYRDNKAAFVLLDSSLFDEIEFFYQNDSSHIS